jgi:hypothetical protein
MTTTTATLAISIDRDPRSQCGRKPEGCSLPQS